MPLKGLKVIDLCRARAGPTAVRQLADWGAEVIKIERPLESGADPLAGNRHGFDFQNLHRNKRSLTLNLKDERGRAICMDLARSADVLVENFRPDVKHRLGIDYETLSKENPRLVYGSISGFGQEGPYARRPGLDQIAQGLSGLMSVTGFPEQGPTRVGIPVADLSAGYHLALGIMIALFERERSDRGQWVHTSLLEANLAMMDFQAARYLFAGDVPAQQGNYHPTNIPTGVFETRDGRVNIQAGTQHLWVRLCRALGCDELPDDSRFAESDGRSEHRDTLHATLGEYTRRHSSDELVAMLEEAGVPCGPIHTVEQTFADHQVRTLAMDPEFEHPTLGRRRLLGQSINLSRTPERIGPATPEIGEHTDEILRELGRSEADIESLRADRVV